MKAFKLIVLTLIVMVLFQGCYTRKLTVDQYILLSKERRVKIKTADDQGYSFKHLYVKYRTLYGVKMLHPKKQYGGKVVTLDLSRMDIVSVKEFIPGRTRRTIGLILVPFLAFVIYVFIGYY